jgi:hypothetical protein
MNTAVLKQGVVRFCKYRKSNVKACERQEKSIGQCIDALSGGKDLCCCILQKGQGDTCHSSTGTNKGRAKLAAALWLLLQLIRADDI